MTWYINGVTSTESDFQDFIDSKGAANGLATLDSGSKVPAAQLPSTVMEYQGNWNATTNTPTLIDGTGTSGDIYICNVAGTQDLGSGAITFAVGDWVMYNGTIWEKSVNSNLVSSVNTKVGAVVLDTDDVSEGSSNLYFSDARATSALSTHTSDTTIHYTTAINFGTKLTGTSHNIVRADHRDKITEVENANTITLTIRTGQLSAGDICCFEQTGAGQVQIAAEDAGKQSVPARCKTNEQYDVIALICVDDTEDAEIYKIIGGVS